MFWKAMNAVIAALFFIMGIQVMVRWLPVIGETSIADGMFLIVSFACTAAYLVRDALPNKEEAQPRKA